MARKIRLGQHIADRYGLNFLNLRAGDALALVFPSGIDEGLGPSQENVT
jgi:hypothetical protein